jgi:hypothetical protein
LIGRNLVRRKKIGRKLIGGHGITNDQIGGDALKTADGIEVDVSDIECYIRCIDTGIDLDIVYDDIASCCTHHTGIGQVARTDQWGIHGANHERSIGING